VVRAHDELLKRLGVEEKSEAFGMVAIVGVNWNDLTSTTKEDVIRVLRGEARQPA
jgi:hypothetical protein